MVSTRTRATASAASCSTRNPSRRSTASSSLATSSKWCPIHELSTEEIESAAILEHQWLEHEQEGMSEAECTKIMGAAAVQELKQLAESTPSAPGTKRRCVLCHKIFENRYELLRHVYTHCPKTYLRWRCDQDGCTRVFTQRSQLNDHIRIVHDRHPFQCLVLLDEETDGQLPRVCGQEIWSPSTLTRHRQQWHGWPTSAQKKAGVPELRLHSAGDPAEYVKDLRTPGIRVGLYTPNISRAAASRKKTTARKSSRKEQSIVQQAKKAVNTRQKTTRSRKASRGSSEEAVDAMLVDDDMAFTCSDDNRSETAVEGDLSLSMSSAAEVDFDDQTCVGDMMDIVERSRSPSYMDDKSRSPTAVPNPGSVAIGSYHASSVKDIDPLDAINRGPCVFSCAPMADSDKENVAAEALLSLMTPPRHQHQCLPTKTLSSQFEFGQAQWVSPRNNGIDTICAAAAYLDQQEKEPSHVLPART